MTLILRFIAAHMGFLWEAARFRIVGSEVTTMNGGDAYLLVESAAIRLRFVCDRRQLLLDFQPTEVGHSSEWFSVDLVRRLFLGKSEISGLLDESYAAFVRDHLMEIETRFQASNWPSTRAEMTRLKAKRAKELFG